MSDLRELYQQVIVEHYKKPRNFAALADANRQADGYNPLCGDRVAVFARVEDEVVRELSFQGAGCAISTASASLMTEAVKGKSVAEARDLFGRFQRMLTGGEDGAAAADGDEEFERLRALGGVREFPMRVKCATLAWHTLQAALDKSTDEDAATPVSTE